MKFRSVVIKFLLFLFSASLLASETRTQIENGAKEFLEVELQKIVDTANFSRFTYELGNLDPRLNLSTCEPTALTYKLISDPTKTSRNTLKVSCEDAWNIILTTKIDIFQRVVVATENINRNYLLMPDQLNLSEVPISELRYGYYRSVEELDNLVAKRHISTDDIITPFNVEGAELVMRGDNVVILASSDILTVKMTGTAMSNGKFGQQIVIKNHSSNRMVKAYVKDRGMVEVPL